VRIDSGVGSGDEISPWYDPMIAKVIVHGPTRAAALNMLTAALADCHIAGPETNLAFLGALSTHPDFRRGQFDTGLIARDLTSLVADAPPPTDVVAVAALAALGLLAATHDLSGFRQWSQAESYASLLYKGTRLERHMTKIGRGVYRVDGDGITTELTVTAMGGTRYALRQGAVSSQVSLVVHHSSVTAFSNGRIFRFTIPDALDGGSTVEAGGDAIMAPMHGLVRSISASPGQTITRGMALVMLEAMKMEHVLKAPRDGVIAEIMMAVGDQVAEGSLLLTLVPEPEPKNG
jgi:3-methylcrotonyl-CoA carboxylase alpha subunit